MSTRHPDDRPSRPVVPPVVLSSTFAFDDPEALALSASEKDTTLYTRWSNPTLEALEARVADLEGADFALSVSSGMAAITCALLASCRRNRVLLVQADVYGGTHELVDELLPTLGVEVRRAGKDDLVEAARELPAGAGLHVELPTNPLIRVVDLPALRAATGPEVTISVDATFATPINIRPLDHGADIVVHSATKYMAGHHDVVAGVLAGRSGPLREAVWELRKLLGPVLDPAAAYRVWRGLETLELRVRRQNETALTLARRLAEHPGVERVHHPGLPDHPDHALAATLLGGAGGVLSFEVAGGADGAADLAGRLHAWDLAPSLGGVRSLVSLPAGVSHVGLSAEARAADRRSGWAAPARGGHRAGGHAVGRPRPGAARMSQPQVSRRPAGRRRR